MNSLAVEDGDLVAGRYAFGGATVAREKLTTPVKVFAVMPKTFSAEGASGGRRERSRRRVLTVELEGEGRRPARQGGRRT